MKVGVSVDEVLNRGNGTSSSGFFVKVGDVSDERVAFVDGGVEGDDNF